MTTTESPTHRLPLSEDAQDLLFRSARTANTFTAQEVSDDQLRAVYGLLRWAPTCFNAQPLRIVAVRGEPARDRLIRHLFGANQDKTRSAPLTLLLAADREFDVHLPRLAPFLSQPNDLFTDPEVRNATAEYNAILQVGYLIIAIRAAGLAAGPMAGFDASGVDAEFFPDGRHHTVLVMNVGVPAPDAWFDRCPRLDYDEVVTTI
jgi:3-hydroxypropanoate dehydrogenase